MIDAALILRLLPEFWHEAAEVPGAPTAALLAAMAAMLGPAEARMSAIDSALDPHRCPDAMLPFLAGVHGLEDLLPHHRGGSGELTSPALRALLIEAPELRRLRGRPEGLRRALAPFAGRDVRIEEPPSRPFHVAVALPARARPAARPIEALLRLLRPAHVTHSLAFDGAGAPTTED